MHRNIGTVDRTIRGVLGIWLLVTGIAALRDEQPTKAATLGTAGVGLVVNWYTGFCGGNALFGIDTSAGESRE
ncbi:YgaP family membrane protein [Halostagnicola kamekurae]|uniref:Inner membrane protein YgaP-like transmembrane domain-containing protein n=1 Tax=Halostagnicola kamekurae TaxID=619731 RepID=A0A1I6Q5H5_9EURY|nr:DUF2892 domain-containing protein [Halostagnicola kamekurae]SFS47731.1 Protein of unknown function [Halostagnicola kamekurae]